MTKVATPLAHQNPMHAAFVTAAQLASDARLLRDEAIAVNANRTLADHILRHAQALEVLRDELHDLGHSREDRRQGAIPRRAGQN